MFVKFYLWFENGLHLVNINEITVKLKSGILSRGDVVDPTQSSRRQISISAQQILQADDAAAISFMIYASIFFPDNNSYILFGLFNSLPDFQVGEQELHPSHSFAIR